MENTAKTYDYSLFDESDRNEYMKILNDLPYDPDLQEFFESQRREANRQRKSDRRHLVRIEFEKLIPLLPSANAEDEYLKHEFQLKVQQAVNRLSPIEKSRIFREFYSGFSQREIAQTDKVTKAAISCSTKSAYRKLRKWLRKYEHELF